MDFGTIAVGLVVFLLAVWYKFRVDRMTLWERLGIPGPKPNFFSGSYFEMRKLKNLWAYEKWKKEYGRVVGFYLGGHNYLLVNDPDLLKRVMVKEYHNFSKRPTVAPGGGVPGKPFSHSIGRVQDAKWKEMRSILTPTFSSSKLKQMFYIMEDVVNTLMKILDEKAKNGKDFDIMPLYQACTMDNIGRTAFGINTNVQTNPKDPFLRDSKEVFSSEGIAPGLIFLSFIFPELENTINLIRRCISLMIKLSGVGVTAGLRLAESSLEVIKLRRNNPEARRMDLLQLMLDAKMSYSDAESASGKHLTASMDDDVTEENVESNESTTKGSGKKILKMNDDEIQANVIFFLLAGFETTSTSLSFTTHLLINNEDIQDKIREEIYDTVGPEGKIDYNHVSHFKYLDQVFNESLRYHPPITNFVHREAAQDFTYNGKTIPAKTKIVIPVWSLHHDEEYWPDHNKFDPERWAPENKRQINPLMFEPFGAGPRNCIGLRFAHILAKLALCRIIQKYKMVPSENTEIGDLKLDVRPINAVPTNGVHLILQPV